MDTAPALDDDDLRWLRAATAAQAAATRHLASRVRDSRAAGRSWTQIAAILGCTRQAARMHYGMRSKWEIG